MNQMLLEGSLHDLLMTGIERRARFEGPHRISLSRDWGKGPRALAIGCNPSTADGLKEDPTSWWWNKWFRQAGFGGYDAANLYPFCTSSPAECRRIMDGIKGPQDEAHLALHDINLAALRDMAAQASQVFVCWGRIAWDEAWITCVADQLPVDLWCWGTTKDGAPKHPLARGGSRIASDQAPVLWRVGRG